MRYDYKCLGCGHIHEIEHPITLKYEGQCIDCGSQLRKVISGGAGTILKGSNWSNDSKVKRELTKKNQDAGRKMKEHKRPVNRLSDLSHGDGLT